MREMMNDGSKELLLFEADRVLLGTPDNAVEIVGNGSSMDSFVGEDGAVITALKMELPWIDEGYEAQIMALEGGRAQAVLFLSVRCVPFQPLVLGLKDCFDYRRTV